MCLNDRSLRSLCLLLDTLNQPVQIKHFRAAAQAWPLGGQTALGLWCKGLENVENGQSFAGQSGGPGFPRGRNPAQSARSLAPAPWQGGGFTVRGGKSTEGQRVSQSESFIEEVTEEVRRDRLYGLMRRYGWIAVLVVLALVSGAAWNEWRKAQDAAAAQATGDALIAALEPDDSAARVTALRGMEAASAGARLTRDFMTVSELIETGATDEARTLLEGIAADGQIDPVYRQLAGFKALLLSSGETSLADRRIGFEGIAQTSPMLRVAAEEQLALIEIEEGNTAAALTRLERLQSDAEATAGLRQRASQLIVALGGSPDGTGTAGN